MAIFSVSSPICLYVFGVGRVRTKKRTRVNRWVRRASGEHGDRPRFISYSPYVLQSRWGEGGRLAGALTVSSCVPASLGLQFCCVTSSPSSGRASVRSCQLGLSCSGLSPFLSAVSWSLLESLSHLVSPLFGGIFTTATHLKSCFLSGFEES